MVAQIAIAQLASFASLLLFASALHKFAGRGRAAGAVRALTGAPAGAAMPVAIAIAVAEFAAAAGLWIPAMRLNAALLAVLVWSGYFLFLMQALAAGRRDVDCGCSFGAGHRPLGVFQVTRAALLALLGVVIALSAALAPGAISYDISLPAIATQVVAGAALLALYGALDQLLTQGPLRAGVQA